jgi:hypothetical protein
MGNSPGQLVWSPVYSVIEERIKGGDDIILILVPFAKLAALQQLHWVQGNKVKLKIVCRWRPEDLVSGVSDVEVFPYLKESGCQLYLNSDIHLKLYVFGSNIAFNTSGNLTLRGLGYTDRANIEVGNMVDLTNDDWAKIYQIIDGSRQVDDDLYTRFKAFVDQQPKIGPPSSFPNFLPAPKIYTISSLPATDNPVKLAAFYLDTSPGKLTPEDVRRAMHDLVTFSIPPKLAQAEFNQRLGSAFLKTPFVQDFIELLKSEGSLRFGAVNNWIHQKCEDVPLPYRWEVKENTRIFYDWLAHYIPDITWDRPNYSQVIYWQKT